MADPLSCGTAKPLPELGEGCVRRFDPHALTQEHGTHFEHARELWLALQEASADGSPDNPATPSKPA